MNKEQFGVKMTSVWLSVYAIFLCKIFFQSFFRFGNLIYSSSWKPDLYLWVLLELHNQAFFLGCQLILGNLLCSGPPILSLCTPSHHHTYPHCISESAAPVAWRFVTPPASSLLSIWPLQDVFLRLPCQLASHWVQLIDERLEGEGGEKTEHCPQS